MENWQNFLCIAIKYIPACIPVSSYLFAAIAFYTSLRFGLKYPFSIEPADYTNG